MSVFRAGTIADVAGTGSPTIVGGELSRSRFNLNGTGTIAARDSFNVSSFVDNGAGDYTANWATAFQNGEVTPVGGIALGTETPTSSLRSLVFVSLSVGSVRNIATNQSAVATDYNYVFASVFGDKP
jgi:hypothetical protein